MTFEHVALVAVVLLIFTATWAVWLLVDLIGERKRRILAEGQRDRALEQAQKAVDGWQASMYESAEALLAVAKAAKAAKGGK